MYERYFGLHTKYRRRYIIYQFTCVFKRRMCTDEACEVNIVNWDGLPTTINLKRVKKRNKSTPEN